MKSEGNTKSKGEGKVAPTSKTYYRFLVTFGVSDSRRPRCRQNLRIDLVVVAFFLLLLLLPSIITTIFFPKQTLKVKTIHP